VTYIPIKTGILRRTRVKKIWRNEARKRLTGVTIEDRLSQLPDKILLSILEIFIFKKIYLLNIFITSYSHNYIVRKLYEKIKIYIIKISK